MKKNKAQQVAVKLMGITKEYTIHHEKPTLVEKIINRKNERFTALNNIDLTIMKGERIAFVGSNGCGKTTLLKIISGITSPTRGIVETNGKIVSLIDLEAGFHPDLTGIQNIFINGLILKMSNEEINKKLEKIIDFADIHQFIDAPLFTYSQGMKLRLGFSIAINADPDILIVDENMSVGDKEFKNKSLNKIMNEFVKAKGTFIMVSHGMDLVEKYSDKVVWLEKGSIKKIGSAKKIIHEYSY